MAIFGCDNFPLILVKQCNTNAYTIAQYEIQSDAGKLYPSGNGVEKYIIET
jgi:hypothetical protein